MCFCHLTCRRRATSFPWGVSPRHGNENSGTIESSSEYFSHYTVGRRRSGQESWDATCFERYFHVQSNLDFEKIFTWRKGGKFPSSHYRCTHASEDPSVGYSMNPSRSNPALSMSVKQTPLFKRRKKILSTYVIMERQTWPWQLKKYNRYDKIDTVLTYPSPLVSCAIQRLQLKMCVYWMKGQSWDRQYSMWIEGFTSWEKRIETNLMPVTVSQWNQFHWMVWKTLPSTNSHLFALLCYFTLQ